MKEEIEYTIKQTQRSIEIAMKDVVEAVNGLQAKIASGDWQDIDTSVWTDGYVARDVARVGALLARRRAELNALRIVKQGE